VPFHDLVAFGFISVIILIGRRMLICHGPVGSTVFLVSNLLKVVSKRELRVAYITPPHIRDYSVRHNILGQF
jgi:hypothetical protein